MAMDCQIEKLLMESRVKALNQAQTPPEKCQFGLSIYVLERSNKNDA